MPENGTSFRLHVSKTKMKFTTDLSNFNLNQLKNIIYSEWGIIENIKIDKNLSMILCKFCLILYRRFKI